MLWDSPAEVRNAASRREIEQAKARQKRRQARMKEAFRKVLETKEGRLVLWEIISSAGVYETPWDGHAMTMAKNVGRGDFGRELLADLANLDESLFMLMEAEARHQARLDAEETNAAHVKPATQQGERNV